MLDMLCAASHVIELDTRGESFHAITVIEGKAVLIAGDERVELEKFQTAVVPASLGAYRFEPQMSCRALKSST
jgi:mannose-6-phosphate isomerase